MLRALLVLLIKLFHCGWCVGIWLHTPECVVSILPLQKTPPGVSETIKDFYAKFQQVCFHPAAQTHIKQADSSDTCYQSSVKDVFSLLCEITPSEATLNTNRKKVLMGAASCQNWNLGRGNILMTTPATCFKYVNSVQLSQHVCVTPFSPSVCKHDKKNPTEGLVCLSEEILRGNISYTRSLMPILCMIIH